MDFRNVAVSLFTGIVSSFYISRYFFIYQSIMNNYKELKKYIPVIASCKSYVDFITCPELATACRIKFKDPNYIILIMNHDIKTAIEELQKIDVHDLGSAFIGLYNELITGLQNILSYSQIKGTENIDVILPILDSINEQFAKYQKNIMKICYQEIFKDIPIITITILALLSVIIACII